MATKLKILFVEDLQTDVELAKRILSKEGIKFQSCVVENETDFLHELEKFSPDIIISDYSMPQFNGMRALEILLEKNPDIPFILLTGSMNEEVAVECIKSGASDYIIKEHMTRLPFAVKEALEKKKIRIEKLNAEKAVADSEKKFRTVVEEAVEIVFTVDNHGYFTYVNPSGLRSSGYSLNELKQLKYMDLIEPEFKQKVTRNYYRQYLERSALSVTEYPFRTKSGEIKWFNQNTRLIIENEEVKGFYIIARDVTERRKVEDALRESEEKYKFLANNTADILALLDLNFNYTYISPSVLRQRGYTVDEAMAQNLKESTTPETLQRAYQLLDEELANEASGTADPNRKRSLELEQYCKDGTTIWIDVSLSFVRDLNGKVTGIFAVSRDVTERKHAEEALKESETKYRLLVENSPDAIAIYVEGKIVFINNQGIRLLAATSAEDLIGKPVIQFIHPGYRALVIERMKETVSTKIALPLTEEKFVRLDGSEVDVEVKGVPITFGNKTAVQLIIHDITERKKSEQKIIEVQMMLHRVINLLPIRVFWKDKDSKFLGCNEIFAKDAGKKNPEELLGKDDYQMEWREQAELYRADDRNIIVSGVPKLNFEEPQTTPSGEKIWLRTSKVPLTDFDGNTIGVLGTYEDITEHKRAEEKLRKSEERLRITLEETQIGTFDWDLMNDVFYVSPTYYTMLGYKPKDGPADRDEWLNRAHPDDKDVVAEKIRDVINGSESKYQYEVRIKHADGSYRWINVIGHTIKGGENNKPTRIIGVRIDITEHKRAEEQLRLSEEKFRKAFITSPDAVIITRLDDGMYCVVNKGFADLMGYSEDEIVGKKTDELNLWNNTDDRIRLIEELKNNGIVQNYETVLQSKNDELIDGLISASIIEIEGVPHIISITRDITKRKIVEQELIDTKKKVEESERKFKAITNQSTEGIALVDNDGNYVFVNPAFCKMVGYSEEELLNMTVFDLRAKTQPYGSFNESKSTRLGLPVQVNLQRKDGTEFITEIIGSIVRIDDHDFVLGTVRDITERQMMEEALRVSEERYRLIAENTADSIAVFDMDLNYTYLSPSVIKLLGYTPDELMALGIKKILTPNSIQLIQQNYAEELELEKSGKTDPNRSRLILTEQIRKDGVKIWVEGTVSFIRNEDGKAIGILAISRDITERKHVEEELRKLSRAIEQSPAGVVITDLEGNIEYANPKALEISGYSLDELVGKNPRIFSSGNKPKEEYKELWTTIISGKEWRGEFQNKRKTGELYWVSALISPILTEHGEIISYLAVQEDITEKKKMISELITAKEKAEEMSRLKSNFLANMSHELRTPLNGILGYAEVLSSSLNNPDNVQMSQTIYDSGKRLSDTLNLILDFSKAETEKIEIFSKNISVISVVNNVVKLFAEAAIKKNLLLETVITDENVYAKLDENLFERTINNLVSNAIKFTNNGKITVEVGKETTQEKDPLRRVNWIYVKVKDTGIGIPEDKIDLIWEEFRQVSEGMGRSFEGTGLGLTLSKRIIELMNGIITVESKVGVGSIFTVKFLASDYIPEAEELKQEKEVITSKHEEKKIEKTALQLVLYVEDDLINQNVVKLYLRNFCSVETANDGKSALQLVSEKKYDIILMDINLGVGMDGMTVTKEIRKMSQYADTPIIAVTAYAMESDKKEFLSGGCSHYLVKPFEKHELLDLITSIVTK
ncbi:MAG: PAS domain S-box protein [Ignavibacteriaceae bacterium]|jgi:PAS domain S-box-containing protein|nr:PAS domain S-box protein [Ignavibacteriaceae bacterium]